MRFTIKGRLPTLNQAFDAARGGKYIEAKLRSDCEKMIIPCIKRDLKRWKPNPPVLLHYKFFEENKRRDKDNVSGYAHKVIQDSLVKAGVLDGDGWNYIEQYDDKFLVDKNNPRIEVDIEEATKVEPNIYDKEDIYPNCTVQILTNTETGEMSVGWWENERSTDDIS